jgi:hypothetical protein
MYFFWKSKQAKLQKCKRCDLYYDELLDNCSHCAKLSNSELIALKEDHQYTLKNNASFGKYLLFLAIILAWFLLLSFL